MAFNEPLPDSSLVLWTLMSIASRRLQSSESLLDCLKIKLHNKYKADLMAFVISLTFMQLLIGASHIHTQTYNISCRQTS